MTEPSTTGGSSSDRIQLTAAVVLGLVATLGLVAGAWSYVHGQAQRRFEEATQAVNEALIRNSETVDASLYGLRGLMHAVGKVDGDQFRSFAGDILERNAIVEEIAYAARVSHADRGSFEQTVGEEEGLAFGIVDRLEIDGRRPRPRRAPQREVYHPLLFKDLDSEDRTSFGRDLGADATLAEAIERAVRTGAPSVGRPRLGLDRGLRLDFVLAIYRDRTPAQESDRVAAAQGVVVLTVDTAALLGESTAAAAAAETSRPRGLEAIARLNEVRDAGEPTPADRRRSSAVEALAVELDMRGEAVGEVALLDVEDVTPPGVLLDTFESSHRMDWADVELTTRFERPVYLASIGYGIIAVAALNGLGLAFLLVRIARSNIVRRRINELLKQKHLEIQRINEGLEDTVAARTEELRVANAEIVEMLDRLDEAVFFFDRKLDVVGRTSAACETVLGVETARGRNLRDLVFGGDPGQDEALSRHLFALELVFGADPLQWDMCREDMLQTIIYTPPGGSGARTLSARYAPIFDDHDRLERVLMIVSDITELLELREDSTRRDHEIEVLGDLVGADRGQVQRFLDDALAGMESLAGSQRPPATDTQAVATTLHTLKGSARATGLRRLSSVIHGLESELGGALAADAVESRLSELESELHAYADVAARLTGAGSDVRHSAALHRYLAAIMGTGRSASATQIGMLAAAVDRSLRGEIIGVLGLFEGFSGMVTKLCREQGLPVARLSSPSHPREVYVRTELGTALKHAMLHGLRNAVGHGLEPADEREQAGKPPEGRLTLALRSGEEALELELADDGRGVDVEGLAAHDSGDGSADAASRDELLQRSFEHGVSTASVVTELSGRGVGLDAVKRELAALGAWVRLASTPGQGTRLVMRIPWRLVELIEVSDGELVRVEGRPKELA